MKNPIAAMIVAKAKPAPKVPDADVDSMGDGAGDDEGLSAAAADILSAVDKRDEQGLVSALRSFVDMCR